MTRRPADANRRTTRPAWLPAAVEAEAYERLRGGDERAFATVAEPLHPVLLRLAGLRAPSRSDAEDVVVRAWDLALGGLETFRWQSPFATWVAGITVGLARTCPQPEPGPLSPAQPAAHPQPGPADWADLPWSARWEGVWPTLRRAVEALPPAQREVLHARDVEGWPIRRVCDVLGLPEARYERLLTEARAQLRNALATLVGGPDAEHLRTAQTLAVARTLPRLLDVGDEPLDPRVLVVFRRWRRARGLGRVSALVARVGG